MYCSFDPATAILELAVHKRFGVLDTVPHMLTSTAIADPQVVKVVAPADVPNPGWLHVCIPSAGQQAWGAALQAADPFVAFRSVVSRPSWSVVFRPDMASGRYALLQQARLVIDGRLNPARP